MTEVRVQTQVKAGQRVPAGRPRSEESRRAIIDATIRKLETTALSDITVESIARVAGVGKSTIYRWWPSRTALVLEAIEELPPLEARDCGSFPEDLRDLIGQLARMVTETPLGKVLAHFAADESVRRDDDVREYFERRLEPIHDLVRRAVARGELPPDADAGQFGYLVMGPLINRTFFSPQLPDDAFIDLVVVTLTSGYPGYTATGRP